MSGKYVKKSKGGGMLTVLILALAAVIALSAWLMTDRDWPRTEQTVQPNAEDLPEQTTDADPTQEPGDEDQTVAAAEAALKVIRYGKYIGAYMEDGTDEIVANVLMAVVSQLEMPGGEELACLPGSRVYAVPGGYERYYGFVQDGPGQACVRAEHRGKYHTVTVLREQVIDRVSARMVLNALDVEHLVCMAGGVILHASYIDWDGTAIVFTAPSGTGKTTQAELWKTHRGAGIVNGDRAVLRWEQDRICAAGLPFAGSSRYCGNQTLPLAAVVYLRQAPSTSIRRLWGREAFRRVWEGCCVNTWSREEMEAASALVMDLLERVPVYELSCTPDESAVDALEQEMRKQVTQ